ncbi:nucleotide modification associated domain-containing protein [Streptomyces sp. NPDC057927]
MNNETQSQHIQKAGEGLTELLLRKNHDYGDSFAQQYSKYGLMSALIRMDDKMRRLETLIDGEQAQVFESVNDTLLDLAGYALLAYVEQSKALK